jgi:histidyl-tRNA synthetase
MSSKNQQTIRAIKGMHDLFEDELATWREVERTAQDVFLRFGYGEIRTPSLEETQLFVRGVGESTDIVEKEMYAFTDKDKKQTSLCLRPENTAGVVRAMVQAGKLHADAEARLFYLGPMFRRERPAKGRYRQFHQLGAEVFGLSAPTVDVEVIALLHMLLSELGLGDVRMSLNSLGGPADRAAYKDVLTAYFTPHKESLCADCQRRLETNVLRILDCKVPEDKALAAAAPKTLDHLGDESRAHFDAVRAGLDRLGVPFEVDPGIVRGLDYYTHTVFEALADTGLGAQNAVAGGGRYDGLVEMLGGRPTPGIGFAAGIERIVMLLTEAGRATAPGRPAIMLIGADDEGRSRSHSLAHELRRGGVVVEVDHRGRSVKAQMKRADRSSAETVLVLGARELEAERGQLKDMGSGDVRDVALDAGALLVALRGDE